MLITNDQNIEDQTYDLCIIGCGAMGIALASALENSGKRILILEGGDEEITSESQAFYRCDSIGHPHDGASNGRFRVYGGSTERWGGQAMRFEQLDFKARAWMNAEEWPISFAEISPFYAAAESFMGIEGPPYDDLVDQFEQLVPKLGISLQDLKKDLSPFKLHNSVFSQIPRLREKYSLLLQGHTGIFILKNASALRMITDGNGSITNLVCRLENKDIKVKAREYILATGGIENARFLLLQKDYYQVSELANHHAIGCYFQDHPGAHVAEISGVGAALFQNIFRLKQHTTMSAKGRITWSDDQREKHELMSVSGTFLMSRESSPFDDVSEKNTTSPMKNDWFLVLKLLSKGIFYSPLHYTILAVSAEDVRDKASRIFLSESKKDEWGQPHAVIDWRISTKVAESIVEYVNYFESLFANLKLGQFRRFACACDVETLMPRLTDNAHHTGSTCIGSSPFSGVVDKDMKVFGFTNLRIAGNSVLPTGSHANPTLTSLALAFRLADKIRR